MKTELLKPTKENLILASNLLKKGEVIGVPTETVYGLAGDCSNSNAIKKIFIAKGRPNDNPLIVHISSMKMLNDIVSFVPDDAKKLAKVFWPGPLTIIMPKGEKVCDESCAGLDTVGVRMPANEIARKIIELSNTPFSAPSANISGKPSPTNAKDVYNDMNGKIPLIIDGGECQAGVESTVISLIGDTPTILRPGVITKNDIEKVLQKQVLIAKGVLEELPQNSKVISPGMKYKHYSPNAEVYLIKGNFKSFCKYVKLHIQEGTYAMVFNGEEKKCPLPSLPYGIKNDPSSQAHNLFSTLRKLDECRAKIIFVRCPKTDGVALAVFNRLIRSAGFKIINADKKDA